VRVEVVVFPSGVLETDCCGVVAYIHVQPTAFVIVSIAPRTSYSPNALRAALASMTAQDLNEAAGLQGRE
jgi:hypothetical protein